MPSLYRRLPPMHRVHRDVLLVAIAVLLWVFDLAWDLVVTLTFPGGMGPHPWHDLLGPHVVRHALLLPILVLCYLAATRIRRLTSVTWLVMLLHVLLGMAFASLLRPFLFIANLLVAGDINVAGTHYANFWDASFAPAPWLSATLVNYMVYLLGLFIIIGVNARLDLQQERDRAAELQARWLNARLDTLRGQLNPHFLFNSLHTISSLLLVDPRRADKLLADFSDVLRISLREGQREFSTVREELDYARRYLTIEETRFEDRLAVCFEVDEEALGLQVPSLILQPLIENAIKHGISNSAGPHTVTVAAHRCGETLVLEVSNDFRADASPVSADRRMGIGLTNVRERLAAIYAADFTLSSQALPGHRWSTRISLPSQGAGGH